MAPAHSPRSWWPRLPEKASDWELTSTFLSRPLAAALFYPVRRRLSPNFVTTLSLLAGVSGALALLRPGLRAPGLGLLFLAMVFDDADGQLARYQGRTSAVGSFWDKAVDVLRFGLLFPVLGWIAYGHSGSVAAAMAGPLAAFGLMVQGYTKWLSASLQAKAASVVATAPPEKNPAGDADAPVRRVPWAGGMAAALLWPFHECDLTLWVCVLGAAGRFPELVWILAASQLAAGAASLAARFWEVRRTENAAG